MHTKGKVPTLAELIISIVMVLIILLSALVIAIAVFGGWYLVSHSAEPTIGDHLGIKAKNCQPVFDNCNAGTQPSHKREVQCKARAFQCINEGPYAMGLVLLPDPRDRKKGR